MQTIESIKNEIASLRATWPQRPTDFSEIKQHKKDTEKIGFLYKMQLYLESNPTEEFVRAQVKELEAKLSRIEEAYPNWRATLQSKPKGEGDEKIAKARYHKEMGVSDIKQQIKTLRYLLT